MTTTDPGPGRAPVRTAGTQERPLAPWDPATANRFHTSDGTALHVRLTGPHEAPVTFVFVHGWTQDHTEWDPVLAGLPGDVRVLRYDHRGHGGSAPAAAGTATLAQLADDLAELIAARVPSGPIVLAGHSMGGMTLMALAERHPRLIDERVRGVALVATSCSAMDRISLGLRGPAGRLAARLDKALGRGLTRLGHDRLPVRPALARPFVRWVAFGKGAARTDVRAMTEQVLRAHPVSIAGFRGSIGTHDRRAALAALRRTPVVVLVGERDRLTPVEHARLIATELPDAEFVLLPGAGHELTYERTASVLARLRALAAAAQRRRPAN